MRLDPEAIEQLRTLDRLSGGSLLRELVELFETRTPPRLERIRASLQAGDAAMLEREAHALKSSAGAIGARSLMETCASLELAGREATLALAPAQVESLAGLFEESLAALRAELAQ